MPRQVSNPPNPWSSQHVEWLEEPPEVRLEVYEEEAKSIVATNDSPDVGFRCSVNPYRGCFHACSYCMSGDTPVLMADGTTRPISALNSGDWVYGTRLSGKYRRLVRTQVLAHWRTLKPAYRVTLEDETQLIASADHRLLTERGWKHVWSGTSARLTTNNSLRGVGAFTVTDQEDPDYRRGYLCGMIRGDGHLGRVIPSRSGGRSSHVERFRLALVDSQALTRTARYLAGARILTNAFLFQRATVVSKELHAIGTGVRRSVRRIRRFVAWPAATTDSWRRGYLAGIFDAEGGYSRGVLRISNTDPAIIARIVSCLRRFGFDHVIETRPGANKPLFVVRVRGGLREHLRFFHLVDPAITRKRNMEGAAINFGARLRVVSVEPLGVDLPMYDITTGTGDFIADGVVSHNCYARPSHQYLGFGAGTDFDRKIVVKTNAPELLRATFERKSWKGEKVVFSGDTDCYQPLEASYELTRRCLEVCLAYRNPVGIITKGALIARDAELLGALARQTQVTANLSIAFGDAAVARKIEPFASSPQKRFEVMRRLADAGVPVGIGLAPIIPGLNDSDIPTQLERARDAGARRAFLVMVRLSAEVLPVFAERLAADFPDRQRKVWSQIRQVRGGRVNGTTFGDRMRGEGPRWRVIEDMFETTCRRLGLNTDDPPSPRDTFRRPSAQGTLFDVG
jgi:DNA repair photolyase